MSAQPVPAGPIHLVAPGPFTAEADVEVVIDGIPAGATPSLVVLADCDRDTYADTVNSGACQSPVGPPVPIVRISGRTGTVTLRLSTFPELGRLADEAAGEGRPLEVWIRAVGSPELLTSGEEAILQIGSGCSLIATAFAFVVPDMCELRLPLHTPHLGPSSVLVHRYQLRRMVPDRSNAPSSPIAGTDWVTGYSWRDTNHLLVSLAGGDPHRPGGVYLWTLGGHHRQLWRAPAGIVPTAPLTLRDGRVVVVAVDEALGASTLIVLDGRRVTHEVPIPHRVIRWVAEDRAGRALLGECFEQGRRYFIRFNMDRYTSSTLAYSDVLLYQTSVLAGSQSAVVAREALTGIDGWNLELVAPDGGSIHTLTRGPGDDWLPQARPGRDEIVFMRETTAGTSR